MDHAKVPTDEGEATLEDLSDGDCKNLEILGCKLNIAVIGAEIASYAWILTLRRIRLSARMWRMS